VCVCVCVCTGRGGQPGHRSAIPWQAVKHRCDAGFYAMEYRPQGTGGSRRRRLLHRKSGCCTYAEGALTRRNMGGSPSTLHYVGRSQRPTVKGVSGSARVGVFRAEHNTFGTVRNFGPGSNVPSFRPRPRNAWQVLPARPLLPSLMHLCRPFLLLTARSNA
jgi:hypothetical protein